MFKSALVTLSLTLSLQALSAPKPKVIYGQDNRVEVSDATSVFHQQLATSTAAMIEKTKLLPSISSLASRTRTLEQEFGVCPTERFAEQTAIAHCSGFLVGPDLLVTAGHCVVPASKGGDQCARFSWVFDYTEELFDPNQLNTSNIYNCKEVLVHALDPEQQADFALIRLDRSVTDRSPLSFRTSGKVETGAELVVIGNPSGLPTKIADGATVKGNSHPQYFVSDLDTYGGNSGSAVIDAQTGVVEGILVRGAVDYLRTAQGCIVSNRCERITPGNRCGGESVSRIALLGIERFLNR